ncbi:MAG: hypothetical protein ACLVJH_15315 [Faecalibacterium prausnitzii]
MAVPEQLQGRRHRPPTLPADYLLTNQNLRFGRYQLDLLHRRRRCGDPASPLPTSCIKKRYWFW